MRLYRCRLDMRACYPADDIDRADSFERFSRPTSGLPEVKRPLLDW